MLAKEKKSFVDLGKRPEMMGAMPTMETKAPEINYPELYLNKDIGLTEADLTKEITATIKIIPTRIAKTVENGKTRHSCDMKVTAIKIGG